MSLYAQLLGDSWVSLPPAVRRIHGPGVASGVFEVQRGTTLLARFNGWLFGLPPAGRDVPVRLEVTEHDGRQRWTRSFGGAPLRSEQHRDGARLVERLGPVACELRASAEDGVLRMWSTGAAFRVGAWWCPLPSIVAPDIQATAGGDGDGAAIDVEIRLAGRRLIRYAGHVEPLAT